MSKKRGGGGVKATFGQCPKEKTHFFLMSSLSRSSFCSEPSRLFLSQTVKAGELKLWENDQPSPCVACHVSYVMLHMSRVICHVSDVMCHMSCVTCQLSSVTFWLKKTTRKLQSVVASRGGSVINGAYPVYFCLFVAKLHNVQFHLYKYSWILVKFLPRCFYISEGTYFFKQDVRTAQQWGN